MTIGVFGILYEVHVIKVISLPLAHKQIDLRGLV